MSGTAERRELWGGETTKAVANFPVSGEPIPAAVAHWLGRIKAAAARANADLGLLDADVAQRIADAGDRIAAGELDDQFPIDVFQTGSGTSSNMNANEVIAALAGEDVHPNDHVNMGQSSNDVFPSAVHLAALDRATNELLPGLELLATELEKKAAAFADIVKSGRTHMMDAVPGEVGDHLVGVHVRRGARAGLIDVDREMRVVRAVGDFERGGADRLAGLLRQQAQPRIDLGRGRLDQAQRTDEAARHRAAGNREILHGTLGLRAPQGVGGHLQFAHAVVFGTERGRVLGLAHRFGSRRK